MWSAGSRSKNFFEVLHEISVVFSIATRFMSMWNAYWNFDLTHG
jgi:hypothetical protein